MQPTYFASFLLGNDSQSTPKTLSEVLEVVDQWIFENPRRPLSRPPNWKTDTSSPISFEGGECVQMLRASKDGDDYSVAVRFEHPDQVARVWRTDCVISRAPDQEPSVRFSVTVAAGSSSASLYPVHAPRSRPRIVRMMIERFGARENYPIKPTFLRIGGNEAERFIGFLSDPNRTLPVVFVSCRNRDGEPGCDYSATADQLIGIAYVCVAENSNLSWSLACHIDNRLNTYDGAVRIYWPKMSLSDQPFRHRLWTQQRVAALASAGRSIGEEVLSIIAAASITRLVSGPTRWEDVEREIAKQAVSRYRDDGHRASGIPGDFDEWLRQYQLDLRSLETARQDLAVAADQLRAKDDEVRQWKQLYLHALRQVSTDVSAEAAHEIAVEDSFGAVEAARRDFAQRLTVIDGRIEKSVDEFEEPELLFSALRWLATTYWSARAGVQKCDDLNRSCREACGFSYGGHQSKITMGMYPSQYELSYQGQKVSLKEHIGYGSSTEPRHTIRLAFFFDKNERKVVIGYIGQHQTTRNSN